MLASRPGLVLKATQDHFLEVLVLVLGVPGLGLGVPDLCLGLDTCVLGLGLGLG